MILAYGTFLPPLFFLTFVIHRAWKRNDYIFFLYFKARISIGILMTCKPPPRCLYAAMLARYPQLAFPPSLG